MKDGGSRRAQRRSSARSSVLFMEFDEPDTIASMCNVCGERPAEVFFAGTAWGCLWLCRSCGGSPPAPKEASS